MVTKATREISVVYGSFTSVSSTVYHVSRISVSESTPTVGKFEADIDVTAATSADFATFETLWRKPRQNLTVAILGNNVVAWSHSAGTGGVDTKPSVSHSGSEETDAGLCRMYTVTVEATLIPTDVDQTGIGEQESTITVDEKGESTGSFSGIYVGTLAAYATAVDTWVAAVASRHSISSWDKTDDSVIEDKDGKWHRFNRTYREILGGTAPGGHRNTFSNITINEAGEYSADMGGTYTGAAYATDVNAYAETIRTRHSIGAWAKIEERVEDDYDASLRQWSRRYTEITRSSTTSTGLYDLVVRVSYDEALIPTIDLEGTWNTTYGDLAAALATWQTAVLSDYSITAVDVLSDTRDNDEAQAITKFTRQLRKIPANQATSTLDHASIINPSLAITRDLKSPGDYSGDGAVTRLMEVRAQYSATIDHTAVTDLRSFYLSTIRPWIVSQATAAFGGATIAVVDDSATWDPYTSKITATLMMEGIVGGSLVRASYKRETEVKTGTMVVPVWAPSPYAGHQFQGPATYTVTETWTRTRTDSSALPAKAEARAGIVSPGGSLPTSNSNAMTPSTGSIALLGPQGQQNIGGSGFLSGGFQFIQSGRGGTTVGPAGTAPNAPIQGADVYRPTTKIILSWRKSEEPMTVGEGSGTTFFLIDEIEVLKSQYYDQAGSGAGGTTTSGRTPKQFGNKP